MGTKLAPFDITDNWTTVTPLVAIAYVNKIKYRLRSQSANTYNKSTSSDCLIHRYEDNNEYLKDPSEDNLTCHCVHNFASVWISEKTSTF